MLSNPLSDDVLDYMRANGINLTTAETIVRSYEKLREDYEKLKFALDEVMELFEEDSANLLYFNPKDLTPDTFAILQTKIGARLSKESQAYA